MIALNIPESEVKGLMNKLLKEETFDIFEIRNVNINSFARFEINGLLDADYQTEDEKDEENKSKRYSLWGGIRPYVFNIIKGAKRPRSMKFVFSVPHGKMAEISNLASVLFLNITFENGEILITTGITNKEFSLDKSQDNKWDDYVMQFLKNNNIASINLY